MLPPVRWRVPPICPVFSRTSTRASASPPDMARGSPAEHAGLRGGTIPARIGERELLLGGDLILEIGSQEACHSECLVRAHTHIHDQSRIPVKFLRGGVVTDVVIDVSATRRSFLN